MKKILIILLMSIFVVNAFALSPSANNDRTTFRNGYAWSGNAARDFATQWAQQVEAAAEIGQGLGTGQVYYVDSGVSNEGNGTSWTSAKDTLDEAINLCTANRGDYILVAQGHAETLGTAELDVAGITIIGMGEGSLRPTFTFDGTADEFVVDAANITVANLRFVAGIAEVANAFDLQDDSDYAMILGCEFPEPGTATFEFDKVFQLVTGADNVTIAGCTVINQAATPGMTSVVDGGAAAIDSLSLINNYINVDADVAALLFSDKADTNLRITGNTVIQEDVDQFCIELTTTATGIIENNIFCNLGGAAYIVDPGSCHMSLNTASYGIDDPGILIPAVTSGNALEVGKLYTISCSTTAAASTDDMWDIAGGPIEIVSLFGASTAAAAGSPGTMTIEYDADAGTDYDGDLSTTVDVNALGEGDIIRFTDVIDEGVLTLSANVGAGQRLSWYCPEGMLEQTLSSTGTLGITWYMTFRPLADGVTVTTQ
jgi:hypothetical protein